MRLPSAEGGSTVARVRLDDVVELIGAMVAQQEAKLLALGRRLVPHLTAEDLLQPHDFTALRESPEFNYEDGILAGLRAAVAALRAASRQA